MLLAIFKPKRTAAASRGFLATARLSCWDWQRHSVWVLRHALYCGVLWGSFLWFMSCCFRRSCHPTATQGSSIVISLWYSTACFQANTAPAVVHLTGCLWFPWIDSILHHVMSETVLPNFRHQSRHRWQFLARLYHISSSSVLSLTAKYTLTHIIPRNYPRFTVSLPCVRGLHGDRNWTPSRLSPWTLYPSPPHPRR